MASEIWQFIPKYEIWFLAAVFVVLLITHELSEESLTWAKLGILVGVTAMVRVGMHSIWKKDEQAEDEGTN